MDPDKLAVITLYWPSKQSYSFRGYFDYSLYCKVMQAKADRLISQAETLKITPTKTDILKFFNIIKF